VADTQLQQQQLLADANLRTAGKFHLFNSVGIVLIKLFFRY
jgi:hypothetical protein